MYLLSSIPPLFEYFLAFPTSFSQLLLFILVLMAFGCLGVAVHCELKVNHELEDCEGFLNITGNDIKNLLYQPTLVYHLMCPLNKELIWCGLIDTAIVVSC